MFCFAKQKFLITSYNSAYTQLRFAPPRMTRKPYMKLWITYFFLLI